MKKFTYNNIINMDIVSSRHKMHVSDEGLFEEWFDADLRTDLLKNVPDMPTPTIETLENILAYHIA